MRSKMHNQRRRLAMELRDARIAVGMQQAEVAEYIGCSEETIRKWELGDTIPTCIRFVTAAKDFIEGARVKARPVVAEGASGSNGTGRVPLPWLHANTTPPQDALPIETSPAQLLRIEVAPGVFVSSSQRGEIIVHSAVPELRVVVRYTSQPSLSS